MRDAPRVPAIEDRYDALLDEYGCQGWWPVTPPGGTRPEYSGGPVDDRQRFEVCCGAILTQNTAWKNASRAITNMHEEGIFDPEDIIAADRSRLAGVIRPSGYYNAKSDKLKRMARFFAGEGEVTRDAILGISGVGPETADSILLYAFGKLFFVIDAYTRRIFSRAGLITGDERYDSIRELFERNLPDDVALYREYHALIVAHAKRRCHRKDPSCTGCCIEGICRYPSGPVP